MGTKFHAEKEVEVALLNKFWVQGITKFHAEKEAEAAFLNKSCVQGIIKLLF